MALKPIPESYCCGCRRTHSTTDFYKSANPFHSDGVLMYCKDSCKQIFDYYLKQTQNIECALWLTCSFLGVPFIKKAFELVDKNLKEKKTKNPNYVGLYMSQLSMLDKSNRRKYTDFSMTDVDYNEVNTLRIAEEAVRRDYERFELDWGKQSVEDYEFLEYRYDIYVKDIELTPAQESLYRQLCLVELRKRKKEASNDSTKEEQGLILTLMAKLKIDDFSETRDKSDEQLLIERQAWEHENHDPCEIVDQEYYKDFCDIGKKWGQEVIRAVKNLVTGSREYPNITGDLSG